MMVSQPDPPPAPPPPPNTPTRANPSVQAAGLNTRNMQGVNTSPDVSLVGAVQRATAPPDNQEFARKTPRKRSLIGGS